jgi:uridine monophosphate synthetase
MNRSLSYAERALHSKNPLAKAFLTLVQEKETNLALSADVTDCDTLLALARDLGPHIVLLKTHVDILKDFRPDFGKELQAIAQKERFFIFEDRKFADIGNTVKHQYQGGIYRIADWADIVNAHILPGPGIISGLSEVGLPKGRGLLLLAEMSSAGNLLDDEYAQKTVTMAEHYPEFVIGFIAQKKLSDHPAWIYMTPGIQMAEGKDSHGQRYVTPEKAIIENQTDIIIVGRGILEAEDKKKTAEHYRNKGWEAYCQRMK